LDREHSINNFLIKIFFGAWVFEILLSVSEFNNNNIAEIYFLRQF